jgi:nucleoside-diphosphate-sugar epimerase
VALVRPNTPAERYPIGANVLEADLGDPTFTDVLPRETEVIVHLAQAYRPFPEAARTLFDVNAGSTVRLADHARKAGVRRIVFASSGSVYPPSSTPIKEDALTRPLTFDPATKLMAEVALGHYRNWFSTAVLRLFAPYGPGQRDRLIPRIAASVATDDAVRLSRDGQPRLNPIYVDDLVSILAQAIHGDETYTTNVAGPTVVSVRDIAEILGSLLGRQPRFVAEDTGLGGDLVGDTSQMHQRFRVADLVEPADGIARYLATAGLSVDAGLRQA